MNPIEIIFRGKDETRAATDSVKKGLDGIEESAKKTGSAFDTAMGVLAAQHIQQFGNVVSGFMTDSIREASEMQDAMVQIEQVLDSTGKASTITAEEIRKLSEQFANASNFEDDMVASGELVLLQFQNIGEEVLPRATQAMVDMATRMGTDLPSAAKILGKAMEGELGSLARLGIIIDDSTKKQIEGLLAVGDTAAAQSIILGEFEKKFGGAAEASTKTWTGAMANLEKSFANLKGAFGEAILNSEAVSSAINHIADAINWLATQFEKMPEGMKVAVAGLVGLVAVLGKIAPALISIKVLFGGIAGSSGMLAGIFGALKAAAVAVGVALAGITAPVWLLIGAIVALIATIVVFGKDALNTAKMIQAIWSALFKRIIFEAFNFANNLSKAFLRAYADARQAGQSIVQGIWAGIQAGWTWLLNMVRTNINSLLQWVKTLIGYGSPAKKLIPYGLSMVQGIGVGWEQGMKALMPKMSVSLSPAFATAGAVGRGHGGNGNVTVNGQFAFYSPLTHAERRTIRRDQKETAQIEMLKMLR